MGPHPAVAAVRLAVRHSLAELEPGSHLVVACSGGADSLALLGATVFESRRNAHRVIGVTVDHGLRPGSSTHAAHVAQQMHRLGAAAVQTLAVEVGRTGGPEAAARSARYAALDRAAGEHGAAAVLLGHTRDDQAETVLLGLARGSGARSLAGMAPVVGRYRRPLLDITREDTTAACIAQDISYWSDPHNRDPGYTRVRVRSQVLPVLEAELGPGVREALARTARLLRADADALDLFAAATMAESVDRIGGGLQVATLESRPDAVRRRVLRAAALDAGCPANEVSLVHVEAMDALITCWHGQLGVDLPGHVRARRVGGMLHFESAPVAG